MKKLLLLLPVLLMACTQPETPQIAVYRIQSDYAAALQTELAYEQLPRCKPERIIRLCSEVSVIRKIRQADDIAWSAIQEAQIAVRSPGFLESDRETALAIAQALTQSFLAIANVLETQ